MAVVLTKPFIRRKELDTVLSFMVKDQIEAGPAGQKFQQEVAKFIGHEAAVGFCDPVTAVLSAFQLLHLSAGDTIALSPLAPEYFVVAGRWYGLNLHFLDTLEFSPVIDPQAVQTLLADPPSLIIVDATLGYLADLPLLRTFGIPLLEDYSHSLGAFRDLVAAGASGDLSLYVMSPSALVSGLGGAVLSAKSKPLAVELRQLADRLPAVSLLGEPSAGMALCQFHEREKLVDKRKELNRHFFQKLVKPYRTPVQAGDADLVLPYFSVLSESGARDAVAYANKKGVGAELAFGNKDRTPWDEDSQFCPHARQFLTRCLLFPLHSGLSIKESELIGKILPTLP